MINMTEQSMPLNRQSMAQIVGAINIAWKPKHVGAFNKLLPKIQLSDYETNEPKITCGW